MPLYKYRPYYKFNGPTRDEPFREELSPEEGKENIEDFFSEIERYFESGTKFERQDDGFIWITSDISQSGSDEQVKLCLNSLDLYANKGTA